MRNIGYFLYFANILIVLLFVFSCHDKPETGSLKVQIDGPPPTNMFSLLSAPSTAAGFTCVAVNVVGDQIPSRDPRFPPYLFAAMKYSGSPCMYPGITSKLVAMPASGTSTSIDLQVPRGFQNIIQVLGLLQSGCAANPDTLGDLIARTTSPDVSLADLYELGRTVVDISGPMDVIIPNTYSSSKLANCLNGNTGSTPTPTPTPSDTGTPTPTPTPSNSALVFAGTSNQSADFTISPAIKIDASASFTIEMFIKPEDLSSYKNIFYENRGTQLYIDATQHLSVFAAPAGCSTGSNQDVAHSSTFQFTAGNKYHVAMTYQGGSPVTIKLWVDGALVATGNASPPSTDCAMILPDVGHGNIWNFTGIIDDVRFSSGLRYTASFTKPNAPLAPDGTTIAFYGLNTASATGNADGAASGVTATFSLTGSPIHIVSPFP